MFSAAFRQNSLTTCY